VDFYLFILPLKKQLIFCFALCEDEGQIPRRIGHGSVPPWQFLGNEVLM
jgi:hypothetical protein